jgi:2,3-bisphosphoglycerate-dependent phosphoglycerate mutase
LFNLNDDEIISLEIPTGNPLLINLDKSCKIISASYLDKNRAENLPKFMEK